MKNYSATCFRRWGSIMTVEDTAQYLGCSTRRVRKLLQDNRLSGVKNGKTWGIHFPLKYTLAVRGPILKVARNLVASGYKKRPKRTLGVVHEK